MQISEPEVREGKGEEEEARFSFLQGGYVEDSRHEGNLSLKFYCFDSICV